MKIVTIIGARPQFIKAAALSRILRKEHKEILIHTGQHFDSNMSGIFFDELELPEPKYNLGISGGSHAQMTGKMLIAVETILQDEMPDAVLLYGDTNSTLAGVLAAVKLRIPVIHVEAGNRLGTLDNPEEVNRITTDHLATMNFCATKSAYDFISQEGLKERAWLVGNVMYDAFLYYNEKVKKRTLYLKDYDDKAICPPDEYCYMTCHRAENTTDDTLLEIFKATDSFPFDTIYAVHPRNKERALRLKKAYGFPRLTLIPPIGYLESIQLTKNAKLVLTDSGGLQCEAFYAEVPCITVFNHIVWPETLVDNRNQMASPTFEAICACLENKQVIKPAYKPFGDGHSCEKIVKLITEHFANV